MHIEKQMLLNGSFENNDFTNYKHIFCIPLSNSVRRGENGMHISDNKNVWTRKVAFSIIPNFAKFKAKFCLLYAPYLTFKPLWPFFDENTQTSSPHIFGVIIKMNVSINLSNPPKRLFQNVDWKWNHSVFPLFPIIYIF